MPLSDSKAIQEIPPVLNYDAVAERISEFISSVVEKSGRKGVVVGLSGGVDSSTVATLAVKALGEERVHGLILPSATTSKGDVEDAISVAEGLGVKYRVVNIANVVEELLRSYGAGVTQLARANVSPRVRMTMLYLHANSNDLIVAGTGNRSELLIGYFTKYGDGGVDILPIGDLYKTQVRALARSLGIKERIVEKVPTAGLWEGQTDEGEIGMSYAELDKALVALVDKGYGVEEASRITGVSIEKVRRVAGMLEANKHKLEPPPIARVRDLTR